MELISQLDVIAKAEGFTLQKTVGSYHNTLSDTKPMSQEDLKLSAMKRESLELKIRVYRLR